MTTRTVLLGLLVAGSVTLAVVLFFALVVPLAILGLEQGLFIYVRSEILDRSGWNTNIVTGVLILAILPLFWAIRRIIASWSPLRLAFRWRESENPLLRYSPYAVIVVYASGYFFLLFAATRGSNFTQSGQALQNCADTPEGFQCFDENVLVHPVYGMTLEPLTPEQVINRQRRELGQVPDEIDIFVT